MFHVCRGGLTLGLGAAEFSSVDSGQQISVLLVLVLRSSSLSLGCFGLKGQGWSGLNENPGEA